MLQSQCKKRKSILLHTSAHNLQNRMQYNTKLAVYVFEMCAQHVCRFILILGCAVVVFVYIIPLFPT